MNESLKLNNPGTILEYGSKESFGNILFGMYFNFKSQVDCNVIWFTLYNSY